MAKFRELLLHAFLSKNIRMTSRRGREESDACPTMTSSLDFDEYAAMTRIWTGGICLWKNVLEENRVLINLKT